ncbi:DUF6025 family protein [Streptomyces sp. NPDC005483]|uniref:DUF6025 family protein n=1 Tax=Streptomyces sp. NPDC005483 TaxID=3154882 RepID=UPI0033AC7D5B
MPAQHLTRRHRTAAGLLADLRTTDPDKAYDVTTDWLARHGERLSSYLRGRFRSGSGVPADGATRPPAVPVEPEASAT